LHKIHQLFDIISSSPDYGSNVGMYINITSDLSPLLEGDSTPIVLFAETLVKNQKEKRRRCSINSSGNDGNTLLHLASLYGSVEIVQRLLEMGAITSQTNHLGFSPIHLALFGNHPECLRELTMVSHQEKVSSPQMWYWGNWPANVKKKDRNCKDVGLRGVS